MATAFESSTRTIMPLKTTDPSPPSSPTKTSSQTPSHRRGASETQFPGKLHNLMAHVEKHGLDCVSWVMDGKAIMIRDPEQLVDILPKFFGHSRYRSFCRQLYMWHFQRVTEGPERGSFMHPLFIKDKRALCASMSRHVKPEQLLPSPIARFEPHPSPAAVRLRSLSSQQQALSELPIFDVAPSLPVIPQNSLGLTGQRGATGQFQDPSKIHEVTKDENCSVDRLVTSPNPISSSSSSPLRHGSEASDRKEIARNSLLSTQLPPFSGTESMTSGSLINTTGAMRNCSALVASLAHTNSEKSGEEEEAPNTNSQQAAHALPRDTILLKTIFWESVCPGISVPASPETIQSVFEEMNQT